MHLFPGHTFKCIAVWFNTMIISFLLMQQSELQYLNLWDLLIHIHQVAKSFITTVFSKGDIFTVILNLMPKYIVMETSTMYIICFSVRFKLYTHSTFYFVWHKVFLLTHSPLRLLRLTMIPFTNELLGVFVIHAEYRVKSTVFLKNPNIWITFALLYRTGNGYSE